MGGAHCVAVAQAIALTVLAFSPLINVPLEVTAYHLHSTKLKIP